MKVIIVGCGRLGSDLAYRLYKRGYDVAVIDNISASFQSLPSDFKGRLHEGDATNQDVLRRAGIEQADAVAVVTNSDPLNLVVGHVAQSKYGVKKVVARNYDPHLRSLFEIFGLQVISSTIWGAQRLEELIHHSDLHTVFSAGNGEVEVYEFTVPMNCNGRALGELLPKQGGVVMALTRAGKAFIPERETILHNGDVLVVSATFDGIEVIRKQLCN